MSDPINPNVPPHPAFPPAPPEPPAWKKWIPSNWQQIISTLAIALATMVGTWLGLNPPPAPPVPTPIFPEDWVQIPSDDGKAVKGFATGWMPPPAERKAAVFRQGVLMFSETDAGKAENLAGDAEGNAFLWIAAIKARGSHIPTRNQGSVGSCVSFGFACAFEYALAFQVAFGHGDPQEANIDVVQEMIYAFSRVEAHGGRSPFFGDGSTGEGGAIAVTKHGVVKRGVYGQYDLTKYDTTRCRAWGRTGVPDELEPEAKKNVVATAAMIKSSDEARKALLQGYPIAVCSDVGFAGQSSRDADGFLRARGSWGHCMSIIGYRKDKDAFYIMNSWGEDWVGGPLGVGNPPPGGFWAAAATVDKMLKQEDSYALSSVRGFPRRKLNVDDWVSVPAQEKGEFDILLANGGQYALAP